MQCTKYLDANHRSDVPIIATHPKAPSLPQTELRTHFLPSAPPASGRVPACWANQGTRVLTWRVASRLVGPHWDFSRLDCILLLIRLPRRGFVIVEEILCPNQVMSLALGRTWCRRPSFRPRKDVKTEAVQCIPKSMPRPLPSRLVLELLDQAFIQLYKASLDEDDPPCASGKARKGRRPND
ncbi:hypothetical protein F5888DRAFT_1161147 [Russula emetica]|nr:hypothetical protein F5888DRAFT_1161147 [Russula emetica]